MAKSETPAGASASVRLRRSPAEELQQAPGLAKARARRSELASELADTTRSSIFPELLEPELLADDEVLDAGANPDEAHRYDGISDDVLQELIGDDVSRHDATRGAAADERFRQQVADGEARADDVFSAARFGMPRVGRARVPMANLEPPSSLRVELTPSPVPRVSLAPATGAVDISLVPGPNARLSRNLPTLAAQHALGRRQPRRAAAPAMTVPPNATTAREPRASADVPKDVRSSKREVVLGLMIGLGLSLALAAAGQAYLREDVIAESPEPSETSAPVTRAQGELESVMLSARPESASSGMVAASRGGERLGVARAAGGVVGAAPPAIDERQKVTNAGSGAEPARHAAASSREPTPVAKVRAVPSKRASDNERGEPAEARPRTRAARRTPASAAEAPDLDNPLVEPSPAPAHLTPAESAGLGLDLPL